MLSMYFIKLSIIFRGVTFNIHLHILKQKASLGHCGPQHSVLLPKQGRPTNTRLPPLAISHTKPAALHPQSLHKREARIRRSAPLCPRLVPISDGKESDCSPHTSAGCNATTPRLALNELSLLLQHWKTTAVPAWSNRSECLLSFSGLCASHAAFGGG